MATTTVTPVLPAKVFDVKVSSQAIFDTVVAERASLRQGTHKTKTIGEVSGGGKKPWAQKHTGRARAGSIRSPIWVGGATVFGPTPERNYELKVNRKVKRLAFNSALTLKAKDKAVFVNEFKMDKPSTKELLKTIAALKIDEKFKKILVISEDENVFKSGRNLTHVVVNKLSGVNVEMIVAADAVILSPAHVADLERWVA